MGKAGIWSGVWPVAGGGFKAKSTAGGPCARRGGSTRLHKHVRRGSCLSKDPCARGKWGAAPGPGKTSSVSEAWADLGGDGNLT